MDDAGSFYRRCASYSRASDNQCSRQVAGFQSIDLPRDLTKPGKFLLRGAASANDTQENLFQGKLFS